MYSAFSDLRPLTPVRVKAVKGSCVLGLCICFVLVACVGVLTGHFQRGSLSRCRLQASPPQTRPTESNCYSSHMHLYQI